MKLYTVKLYKGAIRTSIHVLATSAKDVKDKYPLALDIKQVQGEVIVLC